MVERVVRYRDKAPLMEHFGVEQEIKSTLSRRVDLPSGGYLIFDYAEAFTVIDVNTGRFVGSRGKNSGGRLEDTITKNNLEAVKEVVRQLRLRDIGGIIVIDFIDMANPKNRATVEEALRTELERDRTKTYVVEISPLGLVEMTRQNVTDGPREIMTRKCPTCGGDGIVYSEASAAIDVERRLRSLVAGSRSQAYRVELAAPIAAALIGPGAIRLQELETMTKRRFFLAAKPDMHLDHFVVLAEGKLEDLAPAAPVAEGAELLLELVEVDRHDGSAAVGKVEGFDVCVGAAAGLVGKKVKVRIERVLDGTAYATLVAKAGGKKPVEPLTAEGEAEKPTRKPPARKDAGAPVETEVDDAELEDAEAPLVAEAEELEADGEVDDETPEAAPATGSTPAKKKTRRGSRGGKNRKKTSSTSAAGGAAEAEKPAGEPPARAKPARAVTIHVPGDDLGRDGSDDEPAAPAVAGEPEADAEAAASENGATPAKKKTRRGSRGGKNRRKRTAAAGATNGAEAAADEEPLEAEGEEPEALEEPHVAAPEPEAEPEPELEPELEPVQAAAPAAEPAADDAEEDWGYVPMSEWGDDLR
jgi:ribonuclease G